MPSPLPQGQGFPPGLIPERWTDLECHHRPHVSALLPAPLPSPTHLQHGAQEAVQGNLHRCHPHVPPTHICLTPVLCPWDNPLGPACSLLVPSQASFLNQRAPPSRSFSPAVLWVAAFHTSITTFPDLQALSVLLPEMYSVPAVCLHIPARLAALDNARRSLLVPHLASGWLATLSQHPLRLLPVSASYEPLSSPGCTRSQ